MSIISTIKQVDIKPIIIIIGEHRMEFASKLESLLKTNLGISSVKRFKEPCTQDIHGFLNSKLKGNTRVKIFSTDNVCFLTEIANRIEAKDAYDKCKSSIYINDLENFVDFLDDINLNIKTIIDRCDIGIYHAVDNDKCRNIPLNTIGEYPIAENYLFNEYQYIEETSVELSKFWN